MLLTLNEKMDLLESLKNSNSRDSEEETEKKDKTRNSALSKLGLDILSSEGGWFDIGKNDGSVSFLLTGNGIEDAQVGDTHYRLVDIGMYDEDENVVMVSEKCDLVKIIAEAI